jgi:hypothetical protein
VSCLPDAKGGHGRACGDKGYVTVTQQEDWWERLRAKRRWACDSRVGGRGVEGIEGARLRLIVGGLYSKRRGLRHDVSDVAGSGVYRLRGDDCARIYSKGTD